jgi:ABC-type antimicrobial peptide transport system permease subunit
VTPYLEEALRVLLGNKIRSILTMLGLIIGVGAVVAIQTLGSSMAGAISGSLGNLADNTFFIFPSATQANYQRALIKPSEVAALTTLPNINVVIPLTGANDLIRHDHHQARYFITGDAATPFNNAELQSGRRISRDDIRHNMGVAVITDKAYHKLFSPGENALGATLYVGSHRYVVIGVLAAPRSGLLNAQFGGDVYAPYTTVIGQYMRGSKIGAVRVVVDDPSQIGATEVSVIAKLRDLHGDQNLEYNSFDKQQLTSGINGIFAVMTIVVALIGAVSLLVAGIGIANIMLVSVTERTREIGVRKAIGATRSQILWQFLIEALLLCGIGCAIGMAIGLGIGQAVNTLAIVKLTGYIAPLPWIQSLVITAAFAIIVTLAFGTYPAYRAARLDPIEALRYE